MKGIEVMSKGFALMALAAIVGITGVAATADAEVLLKRKNGRVYFEPYYPAEVYVAEPGSYGYEAPPGEFNDEVYEGRARQVVAFDESYYDPYYLPPSKKLKKAKAAQRAKAKAAALAAAREAEAKAKAAKVAKAKTPEASEEITGSTSKIKSAAVATEGAKKPAGAAVSCEKATSIVSGYGFSTVEATKCTAPTYEFKAQRQGKSFVVKVSSASGELTEVKKLN
jgi:hypothetical protein